MSFFAELKRRNVYKVAALYIIVSWVVLQVVDMFMSFMPLPEWTGRLVFVLLAAGFPVALLLAWALELTPDGIKSESPSTDSDRPASRRADYAIYAVLTGVLLFWVISFDWNSESDNPASAEIRSLVVLPLANLMNDPEQAYFVEGMHEALITELSKIEALRVISRTSAMKFVDSNMSVPEIGRELGVDAIIEGSVLRAGDTVRVTAQLIEAESDTHLWADNFDRELTDILALYSDVTREIVGQIRVTLTPDEVARLTDTSAVDPEGYELYLKGDYLCDQWAPQEMLQGIDLMRQAVLEDPGSAVAHAALAMCYQYAAFFDYVAPLEVLDEAYEAANRAVSIDPDLPEGWVALAGVRYYLGFDFVASELALQRALSLNGRSVRALIHYSWQLGEAGRFGEALQSGREAVQMDPLSSVAQTTVGQAYYLNQDFETAITEYRKLVDLDPADPSSHFFLAWALEHSGEFDQALESHRRAIELSDAQRILDELLALQSTDRVDHYHIAMVQVGLADYSGAIESLERAYEMRSSHMLYIKQGAQFDALRDDERFTNLVKKMGW
jgi:TolB-like protein/tetratricopeptide (TPR) repeat protein